MKKEKDLLPETDLLRKKAEEKLNKKDSGNRQVLSEIDSIKLLHELEVHQIELEMQLEELKVARNKAEIANQRFRLANSLIGTALDFLNQSINPLQNLGIVTLPI